MAGYDWMYIVFNVQSKKLTRSQLSQLHGIEQKI